MRDKEGKEREGEEEKRDESWKEKKRRKEIRGRKDENPMHCEEKGKKNVLENGRQK